MDIGAVIAGGTSNPWLYLPLAVALGALHGLEPGHSKSMMAAFIVAIKGTVRQAALLGLAAAASHTLVVWLLALAGLALGDRLVSARAEPYLMLASGAIVAALALVMLRRLRRGEAACGHDHGGAGEDAHAAAHARSVARHLRRPVTTWQIVLFGLTGGLLPCPASIAVLLVCLQAQRLSLGMAMVLAFSVGLALTLVGVGAFAAWGLRHAAARWGEGLSRRLHYAPLASAALMLLLAAAMVWGGLSGLGARPV